MARNHTGSGVRVSWKMVPAVTEVWQPHPAHSHRFLAPATLWPSHTADTESPLATGVVLGMPDTAPRCQSSSPIPSDCAGILRPTLHPTYCGYLNQADTHLVEFEAGPLPDVGVGDVRYDGPYAHTEVREIAWSESPGGCENPCTDCKIVVGTEMDAPSRSYRDVAQASIRTALACCRSIEQVRSAGADPAHNSHERRRQGDFASLGFVDVVGNQEIVINPGVNVFMKCAADGSQAGAPDSAP